MSAGYCIVVGDEDFGDASLDASFGVEFWSLVYDDLSLSGCSEVVFGDDYRYFVFVVLGDSRDELLPSDSS